MRKSKEQREKEIIDLLKEPMPASKIAALLGTNYWRMELILQEMKKENLLIKKMKNKVSYWERA